jgi:Uma2 family endonuclease
MEALAATEKKKGKRLITLEKFLERYTNREDPFKYEWHKGTIEKKPRTMNRDQFYILQRLTRLFTKTIAYIKGGEIVGEVDMFLNSVERTRRADIAFLGDKMMLVSRNGLPLVCPFVIEIVSKNDQINEVEEKIIEYFENGVQVVWVIFPRVKKVEVYRSIRDITICFEEDICSAAPVLDDFEISVNELLK